MHGKNDIIATIKFFTTEEGGRKNPTLPKLFKCPLEFEGEKFDCALILDEKIGVAPGQKVTVPVVFLYPQLIKPRLKPGSRFTLWSLGTFAEGVVDEIIPD